MLESNSFKSEIWKPFQSFLKFLGNFRHLLLPLIGIYLPLLIFSILALKLWQSEVGFLFPWDVPILTAIHQTVQPQLTKLALFLTQLGGFRGASLIFSAIALLFLLRRQWRSCIYIVTAGLGNVVVNRTLKELLHRARPQLWESSYHQYGYAFPSGHSMMSMTLAAVVIILTWKTPWRLLGVIFGSLFVIAIAWTRLYLGVHYPSDILAGWMVALAWVTGVSSVVKPNLAAINYETSLLPEEVEQVEESKNEA
jgi:membrane-associated phospholipid phosphatase